MVQAGGWSAGGPSTHLSYRVGPRGIRLAYVDEKEPPCPPALSSAVTWRLRNMDFSPNGVHAGRRKPGDPVFSPGFAPVSPTELKHISS